MILGRGRRSFWKDGVPTGWVPIGIHDDVIRWMEFGHHELSEPFFHLSVSRLRSAQPRAREIETDVDILLEGRDHYSQTSPAGVIVHVSRCGSTLVLSSLKQALFVIGLGEAQPISKLMLDASDPSAYRRSISREALASVVGIMAHYRGQGPTKVVIKCSSGGIMALSAIRSLWPTTPCVIIVRNPIEVLVSNIVRPSRWLSSWGDGRRIPFGEPPAEVRATEKHECVAWAIGRMCEEAVRLVDEHCAVVDYDEIDENMIQRIADFFGLSFSTAQAASIPQVLRRYSKGTGRVFEDDREEKRRTATRAMIASVERWASMPYTMLRAKRRFPVVSHRADNVATPLPATPLPIAGRREVFEC